MNQQLTAIWETFADKETPGKRDQALQLAKDYVAANRPALEGKYAALTQEQCVALVGVARRRGDMDEVNEIKTWLLAEYPPQKIVGSMGPTPREG